VVQGVLQTRDLYTLRRGEWAYDNVQSDLIRVEDDIIKIKGGRAAWTCRFFDEPENTCRIYSDRPMECRLLQCQAPARLEESYRLGRLTRRDLLSDLEGLWELIEAHDKFCDYDSLRRLMEKDSARDKAAIDRQEAEMVRYDAELRHLMATKGGLDTEMLDFLLGRPVEFVLCVLKRRESESARR
jgi:Fe-S-cluster containining protein